jgi:hypothetical protein
VVAPGVGLIVSVLGPHAVAKRKMEADRMEANERSWSRKRGLLVQCVIGGLLFLMEAEIGET